ncbi:tRNA (guanosine(37)-N1)-methyltransferase TrmD [Fundicoccus culcitae]|uniref:tRNA (guanine-N(1)-)-methyltransferase n=1 Tax=Fundicoccus culcitae TaxID=2969821 RepID=A0ABY5PAK1_9LACT|nr:tRNA (guanosine(37)-N1)-methyltransferase TrmD [Fundicoccus culcitae]UUX35538.1 tRNA (guanosine(37)-N1)-methyltransferase TrmD [Fundicoccus culcitae]
MQIDILTLFPEMFQPLNISLMGQAQVNELVTINTHDFRQFAVNKHGHVDDYLYGGGAGMLLRVEPIVEMLESIEKKPDTRIILVDPIGKPFKQAMAQEWSQADQLIFICGHYEGYDERVRSFVTDEVSLGDFVLTNGEMPAMVMIDATVRLIPEVLGNQASIVQESFQRDLLEHPQYTRPREYRGMEVPEVLLSGNHQKIEEWKTKEALRRTWQRRPELLETAELTETEKQWLKAIQAEEL